MSVDEPRPALASQAQEPAVVGRRLIRTALKGALATLDPETGHPYASLVLVATEPDGTPIFLISRLALHTRNLDRDARASLLIESTGDQSDPLTGERLTVIGEARKYTSPTAHRRFLARHPSAERYAGFADFSIYALRITRGHYIGGFGRIVALDAEPLSTRTSNASALIEAEPDILAHMNTDHRDAIALYATELAKAPAGDWRMSGIDPEGADLLHCTMTTRIVFPNRVHTPGAARDVLVALAKQARALQQDKA